jgi:hypothetical protein
MSREIKFRAWVEWADPNNGRYMEYGVAVKENSAVPITDAPSNMYKCTLMQFTGLHDRRGKEIWEGDIIRMGSRIGKVAWHTAFASFCIQSYGWMFDHFFKEAIDNKDCEVIGNIYEHPELLEQTS